MNELKNKLKDNFQAIFDNLIKLNTAIESNNYKKDISEEVNEYCSKIIFDLKINHNNIGKLDDNMSDTSMKKYIISLSEIYNIIHNIINCNDSIFDLIYCIKRETNTDSEAMLIVMEYYKIMQKILTNTVENTSNIMFIEDFGKLYEFNTRIEANKVKAFDINKMIFSHITENDNKNDISLKQACSIIKASDMLRKVTNMYCDISKITIDKIHTTRERL